jgi:hypothetical protein
MGTAVPGLNFRAGPSEMNIFANIFSTSSVKMVREPLNFNEISVKVDPGDRELYRSAIAAADLVRCRVAVKETDLLVLSDRPVAALVRDAVITQRDRLEAFIAANPEFRTSLVPVELPEAAPPIVRAMVAAGSAAGVGPMAAVAGAVCDAVAAAVGQATRELILEDRKSTRLNSSHNPASRMPSSA